MLTRSFFLNNYYSCKKQILIQLVANKKKAFFQMPLGVWVGIKNGLAPSYKIFKAFTVTTLSGEIILNLYTPGANDFGSCTV